MRKILYTRPDGGLSIVIPVISKEDQLTEEEAEERAWSRLPAEAINPRWAVDGEIPTDRTFRNAWEDKGSVSVNMPKAVEIHRENLRRLRAPILAAEDVAFMRAIELGDSAEAARIAQKKQALRDVTKDPAIEAAKTPEELAAVIPEILKG